MKTSHSFTVGDSVVDVTAEANDWPDVRGQVMDVDGPHVLVKYTSGNERAKLAVNLRRED